MQDPITRLRAAARGVAVLLLVTAFCIGTQGFFLLGLDTDATPGVRTTVEWGRVLLWMVLFPAKLVMCAVVLFVRQRRVGE